MALFKPSVVIKKYHQLLIFGIVVECTCMDNLTIQHTIFDWVTDIMFTYILNHLLMINTHRFFFQIVSRAKKREITLKSMAVNSNNNVSDINTEIIDS